MSAGEMAESLNGFDEIAITKSFGISIGEIRKQEALTFLRALVFVDQRRKGLKDPEAYEFAMLLTVGKLPHYFADEADEPMPEEPVTDEGKDG